MKKFLILSLALCLTLLTAGGALAAVHNFTGDFYNQHFSNMSDDYFAFQNDFDGWYYIEKEAPSATIRGSFADNFTAFGTEYFRNDQTFADLSFMDHDYYGKCTTFKGSYLFDNNFFVGLQYTDYDENNNYSQKVLSPGYRFDLDKNTYVAVSMDYAADDAGFDDSGIIDFEVNGRYYTNISRIYGQLVIPNEDVAGTDEIFILAGGAYQYSKNLVLGGNIAILDDSSIFNIGCTATFDKLGLDFSYSFDDDDNYELCMNALYSFADNFKAGLEVADEDLDDLCLIAKAKYTVDKQNALIVMQQLENDTYDSITSLRWDIKL